MYTAIRNETRTVSAVAKYEFKSQFRTMVNLVMWLFFVVLVIYDVRWLMAWNAKRFPGFHPYFILLLANYLFTVFSIFFSSAVFDDIRFSKSNDALFVRSFSNLGFILGKSLGVLYLFVPVVLVLLATAFLFDSLVFHDVSVAFRYYFLYPLLITLPVLAVTIGTNLLVMFLTRSKALYVVLLFVLYTVLYLRLSDSFHGVFDLWAFNTPLLASDFTGIGPLAVAVTHRAVYFFWGLACILFTALLFQRLTQVRFSKVRDVSLALICLALAVLSHLQYQNHFNKRHQLRSEMRALNEIVCRKAVVTVSDCDLALSHEGHFIDVSADLRIENRTDARIDTCYFSLNPGLVVRSVECDGVAIGFSRNLHILSLAMLLEPGSSARLSIDYSGSIEESAGYIDIDDSVMDHVHGIGLHSTDKRYAFITPDYVLLTPENGWYPSSGVPYGSVFPNELHRDFVAYRLTVTSKAGLTAVSQGAGEQIDETTTRFTPEYPLPQLSLVIGDYRKCAVEADGVEYAIYLKRGHDEFISRFGDIQDKLPELIREKKDKFEVFLGLDYPYRRFSVIEVPVQFLAYLRYWTDSSARLQPEQVFVKELGFNAERSFRLAESYSKPKIKTPEFVQSEAFGFMIEPLFEPSDTRKNRRYLSFKYKRFRKNPPQHSDDYTVLPQYYDFTNNFDLGDNPFFQQSVSAYLSAKHEGFGLRGGHGYPEFSAMTDSELASHVYEDRTVFDVCADPSLDGIKYEALKIKNTSIFNMINALVDGGDFDSYLLDYLERTRFQTASQQDFFRELDKKFNVDVEQVVLDMYSARGLPAFTVTDVEDRYYRDRDGRMHNYSLTVQNIGAVSGIFSVILMSPAWYRSPAEGEMLKRDYIIKPHEARRIGLNFKHKSVPFFSANISKNMPSDFSVFPKRMEVTTKDGFFVGDKVLEKYPPEPEEGVIIVDNTDPGFEVYNVPKTGITKFFTFDSEIDRIMPLSSNAEPERWQHYSESNFYGFPVTSVHIIRRGKGENRARWHVDVPESGMYNVYCFRTMKYIGAFRQNYIIHHDDGVDDIEKWLTDESPWFLLGTWHFSKGESLVELTDKSSGRLARADALKFVKADKDTNPDL